MRKTLLAIVTALLALWIASVLVPGTPMEYSSQAIVEVPLSRSWELLSDLSLAHEYVTGIERTEMDGEPRTGVGASRRVYSSGQEYIRETVTQWREGEGFTLELHGEEGGAPAPFSQASFRYQLRAAGEDNTLVQTSLRFTLRGGVVGEWLGRVLLGGVFQDRVDKVSAALKQFYEDSS